MKLGVTKQQMEFMEANGMRTDEVVIIEDKYVPELTLEAIRELRVKTEKELETAPEAQKAEIRRFLSRVRRQEKEARRFV